MNTNIIFFSIIFSLLVLSSSIIQFNEIYAQDIEDSDDSTDNKQDKSDRKQEKIDERKQKLEEKKQERKEKNREKLQKLEEKKIELENKRQKALEKEIERSQKLKDKLEKIKEKFSSKLSEAESLESLSSDSISDVKKIQERFNKKIEQLDKRTQHILSKIESGNYLGKKQTNSVISDTYTLTFENVKASPIGNQTSSANLYGTMTFSVFDQSKHNLKLEVSSCNIHVDDIPFSCAFGKARTASSGESGQKDSLVVVAFFEDNVVEELHTTLKIMIKSPIPISEITNSVDASVLSPQSKLTHLWFLHGDATLEKDIQSESDFTSDNSDEDISDEKEGREITINLEESLQVSATP